MSLREEIERLERDAARRRHPAVDEVEGRVDGELTDYGFDSYTEAAGWVTDWYDRGETADGIAAMLRGDAESYG